MIYEFYCEECNNKKEINVPMSEYYIPECEKCGIKMKREYSINLGAGATPTRK